MTRSLLFKLTLALLLVSLVGAALTALFARWATYQVFERLVLEQAQANFVADAAAYYESHGSWQGVGQHFYSRALRQLPPNAPIPPSVPQPASGGRPVNAPQPYVFALVDDDGYVVLPAGPYRPGDQVPASELATGFEVEVDGQVVGIALATGTTPPLAAQEENYLARTNRASLYAALAAVPVALILGLLLVRTLTRPLRELTTASRAMARGDLEQQVPVRSRDELGELAAAFNQMSADLAQAADQRRQMTADIAHDLRTPLAVMAGYLEALRDGVLQPSPARFETLHQEARHLRRLVEDLRTLSLADAGELSLNREMVPPQLVLAQAIATYRHQAEQQGIELVLQTAADLAAVDVDPDRMAPVLGNLLANALRHTPAGGRIVVSARQRGSTVQLVVQDNGEGIPSEMLPHVFDRFYRGDEARPTDESESGLGLAISKSIVELHGGHIAVESVRGQGARFIIALPV